MKTKKINVDKVLNKIKKETRKQNLTNTPMIDIVMDGRTRYGKPVKKVSKVLDLGFMVLAYGILAAIFTLFIILWIA